MQYRNHWAELQFSGTAQIAQSGSVHTPTAPSLPTSRASFQEITDGTLQVSLQTLRPFLATERSVRLGAAKEEENRIPITID